VRSPTDSTELARDIELWLSSPRRRAVLAAVVTLLVSAAATIQVSDMLIARKREFDSLELFAQQLLIWAPWGVLGGPLVYLARWITRRVGSLGMAALVQVPLSLAIAECFEIYEVLLTKAFGSAWLAPARQAGGISFRLTRELLVYWLVLTAGAAIYSFLKSQSDERHAAELRLRAEQLKTALAASRLDTLRNQLHPHFLFNALHSVGALVREHEEQRALQVLASLGSLLRAALEQTQVQETRLGDELELVERYLAIEGVRFGDRLRREIDVAGELRDERVPSLLLLTLVENAVRHGISQRVEGGCIAIRARARDARLEVEIEDDGPGFAADVLAGDDLGPQHTGLANCRRRLALLYGDEGSLALANDGGRARVAISLPRGPSPRGDQPAYSGPSDG
jgi:sensor histidine kinase YesM